MDNAHPLVKLAAVIVVGLAMWIIFGRIGGRPFPG
jgi:hypothetical protein